MDQGAAVIERFYGCFGQRDADGMAACYTDDVVFSDPAFGELHGERARDMWRMLCRNGKDLAVVTSGVSADGDSGSCPLGGRLHTPWAQSRRSSSRPASTLPMA